MTLIDLPARAVVSREGEERALVLVARAALQKDRALSDLVALHRSANTLTERCEVSAPVDLLLVTPAPCALLLVDQLPPPRTDAFADRLLWALRDGYRAACAPQPLGWGPRNQRLALLGTARDEPAGWTTWAPPGIAGGAIDLRP